MSHYDVTFKLDGLTKIIEVPSEMAYKGCPVSLALVRSRLRFPKTPYSGFNLNAAGIVLSRFPNATDIEIDYVGSGSVEEDKKSSGLLVLIMIGIILALIFAPILIVLGMHKKFLFKGVYEKAQAHPKFLKLRKLYTIFGFIFFGICFVTLVVFMIVGNLPFLIPLYILIGGNIAGFVFTAIYSKKLAKSLPKKPTSQKSSSNLVVAPASNISTSQTINKPIDPSKNLELSNLLIKYKELYDKQIISIEEYEKLKSTTLASMVSTEQTVPIEDSPVPFEENKENTQETASFKENKNDETISSIDEYFEKYAKEHQNDNQKPVVITSSPKKESSLGYSVNSSESKTTKPKKHRFKLFEIVYLFEGAKDNFELKTVYNQYRVNSFVLLVMLVLYITIFIIGACISFVGVMFYIQLVLLIMATVSIVLLCITHQYKSSLIFKILALVGMAFLPVAHFHLAIMIIILASYVILAIYTIFTMARFSNIRRDVLEAHNKNNLDSNPYANKKYINETNVSKLSPENKWAVANRIKRLDVFNKIVFAFSFVVIGLSLLSFIFMFVPTVYNYYDINTHQYYRLSLVPIEADVTIRAVLIVVSLVIIVTLFVLRFINNLKKYHLLFETLFGLLSVFYLVLVSLSLYSAYGNTVVALVDIIAAPIIGLFYVITSPIRLGMKKNINKFIQRNALKENNN